MTEFRYPSSLGLLELPNEVLIKIFNSAEDRDLHNLRLTCRELYDTATPHFAKVNFTERFHVVSPYSIDTLVKITEHPVFGGYVKTVAVSSARQTTRPYMSDFFSWYRSPNQDICIDAYMKTRRFSRRMERVFENIRSRSGSVAISIYESPDKKRPRSRGWARLNKPLATRMLLTPRPSQTLEETVYAARRARCPITSIQITKHEFLSQIMHDELEAAMHRVLESNVAPLNLNPNNMHSDISYDNKSQHSKIFGSSDEIYGMSYLGRQASYDWLLTQKTTQLSIGRNYRLQVPHVRPFFSHHLRCLNIYSASLLTAHFDRSLWSEIIETISGLPGLRYCKLGYLGYRLDLE